MKKRMMSVLLTLCMLVSIISAVPITASAATSGTCGDNLTWTLDDNGTLTISGTGRMWDWDSWNSPWFNNDNVKNAVINNGVTSIGEWAFYYCSSLTSISLPNSVTSIGNVAFRFCSSLTSISLPNSVTSIGDSTFSRCSSLTSISIPGRVTSIGDSAFSGCSSLTSIRIPGRVTSIGEWAFRFCSSLTSISIPSSVTSIGNWAFDSCRSLKDVYYSGSPEQWKKISVGSDNEYLTNAAIHYGRKDIIHTSTPVSKNYGVTKFEYTPEGRVYNAAKEFSKAQEEYLASIKTKAKKAAQGDSTLADKARTLMSSDDENSHTENKYINFSETVPEKVRLAAYEGLAEYFEVLINKHTEKTGKSPKDFGYSIDDKTAKQILSEFFNYNQVKKYEGYTVSISAVSFMRQGVGQMTVKNGNKQYTALYNSKPREVAEAMNELLQYMKEVTDDLVKDAASSLLSDLSDITGVGDFFRVSVENSFMEAAKKLRKHGFGNLMKFFKKCSDGYDAVRGIIAFSDPSNIRQSLSGAQEIYNKIYNLDYSDKAVDDFAVKYAMDKLNKARKTLEDSLYDYITDNTGSAPKTPGFFDNVKSWFTSWIQCPVDFKVYDENGTLIGYAENGAVYYNDEIYIETSGDVKKLYVPHDMHVQIEMNGTDEGSFNYILEEVVDGKTLGRLNYYDIELDKDSKFEQSLSGEELSADDTVIKTSDNEIKADEHILASSETNFITVETECNSMGTIIGGGQYPKGDSVELTALSSDEKYRFVGWYTDNELVCTDSTYRFTALKDVKVYAKFERTYPTNYDYSAKMSDSYDEFCAKVYKESDGEEGVVIIPFTDTADSSMTIYVTGKTESGEIVIDSSKYTADLGTDGLYVFDDIKSLGDMESFTVKDGSDVIITEISREKSDKFRAELYGKYQSCADVTAALAENTVTVDFYMLDDTLDTDNIIPYLAVYNEDGTLSRCEQPEKSETEYGVKYTAKTESEHYSIMFWDKDMNPITENITPAMFK